MNIIYSPKVKLISITTDAEQLIAMAGKRCYFGPEFSELKEDDLTAYIAKLLSRGHLSVFEHASATFDIQNVSRVFLAQLTRHRVASYSVESQRYREQTNFDFVMSDTINTSHLKEKVVNHLLKAKELYEELIAANVTKEDARYILPNGGTTSIIFTANFRELLHILDLREAPSAQKEIRVEANAMRSLLHDKYPNIF